MQAGKIDFKTVYDMLEAISNEENEDTVGLIRQRIQVAERDITSKDEEIKSLKRDKSSLEEDVTSKDKKIETLEKEKITLEREKITLEKEKITLEKEKVALEKENKSLILDVQHDEQILECCYEVLASTTNSLLNGRKENEKLKYTSTNWKEYIDFHVKNIQRLLNAPNLSQKDKKKIENDAQEVLKNIGPMVKLIANSDVTKSTIFDIIKSQTFKDLGFKVDTKNGEIHAMWALLEMLKVPLMYAELNDVNEFVYKESPRATPIRIPVEVIKQINCLVPKQLAQKSYAIFSKIIPKPQDLENITFEHTYAIDAIGALLNPNYSYGTFAHIGRILSMKSINEIITLKEFFIDNRSATNEEINEYLASKFGIYVNKLNDIMNVKAITTSHEDNTKCLVTKRDEIKILQRIGLNLNKLLENRYCDINNIFEVYEKRIKVKEDNEDEDKVTKENVIQSQGNTILPPILQVLSYALPSISKHLISFDLTKFIVSFAVINNETKFKHMLKKHVLKFDTKDDVEILINRFFDSLMFIFRFMTLSKFSNDNMGICNRKDNTGCALLRFLEYFKQEKDDETDIVNIGQNVFIRSYNTVAKVDGKTNESKQRVIDHFKNEYSTHVTVPSQDNAVLPCARLGKKKEGIACANSKQVLRNVKLAIYGHLTNCKSVDDKPVTESYMFDKVELENIYSTLINEAKRIMESNPDKYATIDDALNDVDPNIVGEVFYTKHILPLLFDALKMNHTAYSNVLDQYVLYKQDVSLFAFIQEWLDLDNLMEQFNLEEDMLNYCITNGFITKRHISSKVLDKLVVKDRSKCKEKCYNIDGTYYKVSDLLKIVKPLFNNHLIDTMDLDLLKSRSKAPVKNTRRDNDIGYLCIPACDFDPNEYIGVYARYDESTDCYYTCSRADYYSEVFFNSEDVLTDIDVSELTPNKLYSDLKDIIDPLEDYIVDVLYIGLHEISDFSKASFNAHIIRVRSLIEKMLTQPVYRTCRNNSKYLQEEHSNRDNELVDKFKKDCPALLFDEIAVYKTYSNHINECIEKLKQSVVNGYMVDWLSKSGAFIPLLVTKAQLSNVGYLDKCSFNRR